MSDSGERNITIGSRIREVRAQRELSQATIAAILNIPRSAVSLLESGKRELMALELRKLSLALAIRADWFLED
jgi:transcriptional regulator with XRE-family HTH domain